MEKKKSFESSISELESIVKRLESGEVSLEESLTLFEDGMTLANECKKMLDLAHQRVKILLTQPDGEAIEQDFLPSAEN